MGQDGVSRRIVNARNVLHITGGLAIITGAARMFFAAVSGPVTAAAIGSMAAPTMPQKGYSKSFTLALIACAGRFLCCCLKYLQKK